MSLPHFADMRDGALVSFTQPASDKLINFTKGAAAFSIAVILILIILAARLYATGAV